MHVLRAEKGFIIVGQDTDGSATPSDLNMDWIVSKKKEDFLGKRSFIRSDTARENRKHLVGLLINDKKTVVPEGSHIVDEASKKPPMKMSGHITSSYYSPTLGYPIAMAMLKNGKNRHGENVLIPLMNGKVIEATVSDQMISSPLISKEDFQANGINLTSTEFVGKLNFRCNSDNTIILNKIKDITGINLPLKAGEVFGNNEYRIQWLGPNEWIIQCADNEKNSLMNNIRSQLSSEHFSLTDISDYYLTIRLSGSNSNEILSKGTSLDLKSYICNKDMCAQTYIAKATVLIDRLSNEPMYDISVRWSYAEYLWEWLVDASYEFTE